MAQYNIMLLTSNLIMLKHLLVSLYLLCICWYHKLLTNNRWPVSVAFLSPKVDTATSFWMHQYFPNLDFSGLSHSASQHAQTCSCLDDAEQHKGQSLITHLPALGSHRPGAPLPVPPAEPDPKALSNSGQECATRARCLQLLFSRKAQGPIYVFPFAWDK